MATSKDPLPGLLKDREAAQAKVDGALEGITEAQAKVSEAQSEVSAAESELAKVNAAIAKALGIEIATKPRAAAGRTNHERVLDVLKGADAPLKRAQIAKELDAEPNSVGAALAYLKARGEAAQEGTKSAAMWASKQNAEDWWGAGEPTEEDLATGRA